MGFLGIGPFPNIDADASLRGVGYENTHAQLREQIPRVYQWTVMCKKVNCCRKFETYLKSHYILFIFCKYLVIL